MRAQVVHHCEVARERCEDKRGIGLGLTRTRGNPRLALTRTDASDSRRKLRCVKSGPSKRGEHRPIKWDRRVCGEVSSTLGVARWGRSAGCVLCALWAVSTAMLGGEGGGTLREGKHIISNTPCHYCRVNVPQPPTPASLRDAGFAALWINPVL